MVSYYYLINVVLSLSLCTSSLVFANSIDQNVSNIKQKIEQLKINFELYEMEEPTYEKIQKLWNDLKEINLPKSDPIYSDEINSDIFGMEDEIKSIAFSLEHLGKTFNRKKGLSGIKIYTPISIMYLVLDSDGVTRGKQAYKINGDQTFGGVTEDSNELRNFSIPIKIQNIDPSALRVDGSTMSNSHDNENVCSQVTFNVRQNEIIPVTFPNSVNTATSCKYNIYYFGKKEIASFTILLNHTFKYWTNSSHDNIEILNALKNLDYSNYKKITEFKNELEIIDLSPLTGFINIKKIRTKVKNLQTGIFNDLKNIGELDLSHGALNYLPHDIFYSLNNLTYLYLGNNEIENIPHNIFQNLTKITYLYLRNNRIELIKNNVFRGLNQLKKIDLTNNKILKIDDYAFQDLLLDSLHLNNNKISNISINIIPKNLVKIDDKLSFCRIGIEPKFC